MAPVQMKVDPDLMNLPADWREQGKRAMDDATGVPV
jgi:hypothetical protein